MIRLLTGNDNISFILIIILLLSACSSSKHYFYIPEYRILNNNEKETAHILDSANILFNKGMIDSAQRYSQKAIGVVDDDNKVLLLISKKSYLYFTILQNIRDRRYEGTKELITEIYELDEEIRKERYENQPEPEYNPKFFYNYSVFFNIEDSLILKAQETSFSYEDKNLEELSSILILLNDLYNHEDHGSDNEKVYLLHFIINLNIHLKNSSLVKEYLDIAEGICDGENYGIIDSCSLIEKDKNLFNNINEEDINNANLRTTLNNIEKYFETMQVNEAINEAYYFYEDGEISKAIELCKKTSKKIKYQTKTSIYLSLSQIFYQIIFNIENGNFEEAKLMTDKYYNLYLSNHSVIEDFEDRISEQMEIVEDIAINEIPQNPLNMIQKSTLLFDILIIANTLQDEWEEDMIELYNVAAHINLSRNLDKASQYIYKAMQMCEEGNYEICEDVREAYQMISNFQEKMPNKENQQKIINTLKYLDIDEMSSLVNEFDIDLLITNKADSISFFEMISKLLESYQYIHYSASVYDNQAGELILSQMKKGIYYQLNNWCQRDSRIKLYLDTLDTSNLKISEIYRIKKEYDYFSQVFNNELIKTHNFILDLKSTSLNTQIAINAHTA